MLGQGFNPYPNQSFNYKIIQFRVKLILQLVGGKSLLLETKFKMI